MKRNKKRTKIHEKHEKEEIKKEVFCVRCSCCCSECPYLADDRKEVD